MATLEGHTYDVRALLVHDNRLYSAGYDSTVKVSVSCNTRLIKFRILKIWDLEHSTLIHTISFRGPPFALQMDPPTHRLFAAGWNRGIEVLQLLSRPAA